MAKRKRQNHVNYDFDYEPSFKLHKTNNIDNITRLDNFHIKEIEPKTKNQEHTFNAYRKNKNLLLHGSAGTGKTFISLYLGLNSIMNDMTYHKLVIVRNVVPTREVGHLPGDLDKKIEVYELPYKQIINQLFHRGDAYEIMKKKRKIEFLSTSFIRGITFENTIVIVDEFQNMNDMEIHSIITRIGNNCKIIFSGDTNQNDLSNKGNEKSGLNVLMNIVDRMDLFTKIQFSHDDIVRSDFVKSYIIARDKYFSNLTY
jgi:predicted ribonuclease YlaK